MSEQTHASYRFSANDTHYAQLVQFISYDLYIIEKYSQLIASRFQSACNGFNLPSVIFQTRA